MIPLAYCTWAWDSARAWRTPIPFSGRSATNVITPASRIAPAATGLSRNAVISSARKVNELTTRLVAPSAPPVACIVWLVIVSCNWPSRSRRLHLPGGAGEGVEQIRAQPRLHVGGDAGGQDRDRDLQEHAHHGKRERDRDQGPDSGGQMEGAGVDLALVRGADEVGGDLGDQRERSGFRKPG